MKPLSLSKILQSQGLGSRKQCEQMIRHSLVCVNGALVTNPNQTFMVDGLSWTIEDELFTYHEKLYVLLHKPAGYECSHQPIHHPSVYSLLPAHFIARGVQCVGRLDQDTTGVLLLTDDGVLNHALTHPKKHVTKTYIVTVKHPLTEDNVQSLLAGVLLHDENEPIAAIEAEIISPLELRLVIAEGKYHQVKRMVAAVGNRVEALHRASFGQVTLSDLAPSGWTLIDKQQLA
ncbi:16S rRNA pseudouridine(516) synthase [Leeia sp. TBRC 13508]|uniref:Pseudouridine synthase n=1 Tax=Leeia speluncae TaxID=2884804 RepID=A0ABS8D5G0_9NEIS|nr:16S rRNA pseudouridine(516) synthase [Leeia speluncae]MCB6183460.1 16S rRNA pseudouridine(516) synthase [Leeia speluncae]